MKRFILCVFVALCFAPVVVQAQTTSLFPEITVPQAKADKAVWAICAFNRTYTNMVTGEVVESPVAAEDVADGTITEDSATWTDSAGMQTYFRNYLIHTILRRQYEIVKNRVAHDALPDSSTYQSNFDE